LVDISLNRENTRRFQVFSQKSQVSSIKLRLIEV
jgi:hypothetical protein